MPDKRVTKALIELSSTVKEADAVIIDELGDVSTREKLAYLKGMFDVEIIGRTDKSEDNEIDTDYLVVLEAIINDKWR